MGVISLKDAKAGKSYVIRSITPANDTQKRLIKMGFTKNTALTMCDRAPFGDPIWVFLRGSYISLRLSDAEMIGVEEI
ncbi:MAG: ferrous iron transport protein A [Clostridiales bacterium]|nr:ferrous iron transport protein A [Clostridiales bacterium]